MPNGLWERLRHARSAWILAMTALAALLALLLLRNGGSPSPHGTELETRLERILNAVDGADRVRAMVSQGQNGEITGAVVVAEGLEDVSTYLKLQGAVMTLLGLDAGQVEIIGGRFGGG